MAPSSLFLAADSCGVAALGGEDIGVAGVRVTPADVLADRSRKSGMIAVIVVRDDELAQRIEVRLD